MSLMPPLPPDDDMSLKFIKFIFGMIIGLMICYSFEWILKKFKKPSV